MRLDRSAVVSPRWVNRTCCARFLGLNEYRPTDDLTNLCKLAQALTPAPPRTRNPWRGHSCLPRPDSSGRSARRQNSNVNSIEVGMHAAQSAGLRMLAMEARR
ncbi:hypothetical protein SBA4_20079 [Candidatus Sulfopaludibacter sp. SbA4]|nr:hypothetical protein SBA4_20079 [Candidatus Sulfopaludibacter sp. SbA4]